MSDLAVVQEALALLEALLDDHGPACVCRSCTLSHAATALVDNLAVMVLVLQQWSREDASYDEPLTVEDLRYALRVLHD